jgi:large subunit ribosomal protein L35
MKNKIKTHRGMAKRIKMTGTGKIVKQKAKRKQRFSRRGMNSFKPKNKYQKDQFIEGNDLKRLKQVLHN